MKINTLTSKNPFYPKCLKFSGVDVPLDYFGTFHGDDENAVGIVGSRECSRYGRRVVSSLVSYLTRKHITIASGLSYGIDECVIRHVLACSGRILSFLGCSFNSIKNNKKIPNYNLISKVVNYKSSVVISPFTNTAEPTQQDYLLRDYFLAAFCKCIVVVEAGESSNLRSLVDSALNFGKTVYAVPGSIFSEKSVGTHKMIEEGAFILRNFSSLINS